MGNRNKNPKRFGGFLFDDEPTLMHVSQPQSLDREAIELNKASEDALPMTFVDYAEMVWRKLSDEKTTQQIVADEMGWSRSAVSNYAALSDLDRSAWKVVATTVANGATQADGSGNSDDEKVVAGFTEGLLRDLLAGLLLPKSALSGCSIGSADVDSRHNISLSIAISRTL